jgi:hypothetical protein
MTRIWSESRARELKRTVKDLMSLEYSLFRVFSVTVPLGIPRCQSTKQDAMMSIPVSPINDAGTKFEDRGQGTRQDL